MITKVIWMGTSCFTLVLGALAADLQVTLRVKDDFGKPVVGAEAGISIFQLWLPGDEFGKDVHKQVNGITDASGIVVLKGRGRRKDVSYGVSPTKGYYYSRGGEYWFRTNVAGRWQPWNPTIDIVLKPIVNPVPMYARHIKTHFSEPGKEYGFDLMVGDWVAPHGKGQTTDFVFQVSGYWNSVFDLDSTLILTFANPSDGIQPFAAPPTRQGSALRSPREAPLDGYKPKMTWRRARKPNQLSPQQINETKEDSNYFFRVRTVTDEQGNVKSALYGKIYEGFKFDGATTNSFLHSGPCYLNPEPNSRNMEFDPKRNLAKDLKSMDGVSQP